MLRPIYSRLPMEEWDRLDKYSKESNITKMDIIRAGIALYLDCKQINVED